MGSTALNDFVTVAGNPRFTLQTHQTVTRGVKAGEEYAFRYRAINKVGAGPWSETVLIRAATTPDAPGKPFYISSTDTSITIGIKPTLNNGGSKLTKYSVIRDQGNLTSDINVIESGYNGIDLEYTIQGLTPGNVYRIASFVSNEFGDS